MVKRILQRLGLLGLGLVGAVTVLEIAIRVTGLAAPFAPSVPTAGSGAAGEAPFVVLCVGDSHTWGRGEGFPAHLSHRLARISPRYRVVNLGIPGTNTAQLRNRLSRYLDAYQPRVVVLWTGVNNHWNRAETKLWGQAGIKPQSVRERVLGASRVLRFFRVWRDNVALNRILANSPYVTEEAPLLPGDPRFRLHRRHILGEEDRVRNIEGNELRPAQVVRVTAFDFVSMIELMQSRDIHVVVIKYPQSAPWYENANEGIRRAALATGTPEASTWLARERVIAEAQRLGRPRPGLLNSTVHPTEIFYKAIGDVVLETMEREGYLLGATEVGDANLLAR